MRKIKYTTQNISVHYYTYVCVFFYFVIDKCASSSVLCYNHLMAFRHWQITILSLAGQKTHSIIIYKMTNDIRTNTCFRLQSNIILFAATGTTVIKQKPLVVHTNSYVCIHVMHITLTYANRRYLINATYMHVLIKMPMYIFMLESKTVTD